MCSGLKHGARGPKRFGMSAQGARGPKSALRRCTGARGPKCARGRCTGARGPRVLAGGGTMWGFCGRNLVPFFSFGDHAGFITEYIVPFSF